MDNKNLQSGIKGIFKSTLLLFVIIFSFTTVFAQINPNGDPSDWPPVLNGTGVKTFVHDSIDTNDDQFTQGSSDVDPIEKWRHNRGNTNDKGDIVNTGAALIGSVLYFFGDRTSVNGNAQIGFWFFLDNVFPKTDGKFNGTHKPGDLLILSNFTNGGGAVNIRVFIFTGTDKSGKSLFDSIPISSAVGGAFVNATQFDVPTTVPNWTFTAKGGAPGKYITGTFFEGFVDLSKITGANICFQQYLMETRNSASISASQQDMAAGQFAVLPNVNLSVGLKPGVTTGSPSEGCPKAVNINANVVTFLGLKATGANTYTFSIERTNNTAIAGEVSFVTVGTDSATFTINNLTATQFTYRVIVTGSKGTGCDDKDTVCIQPTGSAPNCDVSGPAPVCPKTVNWYFYDPDGNGVVNPIPTGFTPTWSLENNTNNASLGTPTGDGDSVAVTAGAACNTAYTVKLTLSTSGLGSTSCDTTVEVKVNSELSLTCPTSQNVSCGSSYNPSTTGLPTVPNNGCGVRVYYKDVVTRTWFAVDSCGTTKQCTQTITTTDSCVVTPNSGARMITNNEQVLAIQGTTDPVKETSQTVPRSTAISSANTGLQVQAFPNPFSNTVNFRFVSPVSGRATLEVFNSMGQLVGVVFSGTMDAGVAKYVQFSTRLSNQTLIYRLRVGDKIVRGSILELNK